MERCFTFKYFKVTVLISCQEISREIVGWLDLVPEIEKLETNSCWSAIDSRILFECFPTPALPLVFLIKPLLLSWFVPFANSFFRNNHNFREVIEIGNFSAKSIYLSVDFIYYFSFTSSTISYLCILYCFFSFTINPLPFNPSALFSLSRLLACCVRCCRLVFKSVRTCP